MLELSNGQILWAMPPGTDGEATLDHNAATVQPELRLTGMAPSGGPELSARE